jgi:hypothetical protein
MNKLIIVLVALICFGCQSSTTLAHVHYSNLQNWELVNYPKMRLSLEAPKDRLNEEIHTEAAIKSSGRMMASFNLHVMNTGFLVERRYGISILLEVFSKQEWQKYLQGDRSLTYVKNYGKYKAKFQSKYLNHRKDIMASDGTVCVASANYRPVGRDADGILQDEAAIRRIIKSVRFIE